MSSLICRNSLLSCSQPTQCKPYFDDRIEIENPGVLIPGLSIEDLPRGISRLRNLPFAQALGRDSVSGALSRAIRQLLDREEIGYTLPDTPNSRLQKYQRLGRPQQ